MYMIFPCTTLKMSIRSHYDLHVFCLEYYEILLSCDADGGMFVKKICQL